MEGLFRAIAFNDADIQTVALEALAEVPTIAYSQVSDYIMRIGELTQNFINLGATLKYKQIIQFWTNLCVEEAAIMKNNPDKSKNIINQFHQSLIPIIHQGLTLTEFDDDDKETEESNDDINWTVSRASAALLTEFTIIMQDAVLHPTIQFASTNISGQTWQEHYVGMIALGSVLEGPS